jgi:hypothetical protein
MGCGLAVTVFGGEGVSLGWVVEDAVGASVEVVVAGMLVALTCSGVSEGVFENNVPSEPGLPMTCLIAYPHPARMSRLITTSTRMPVGVMRIVHPTRLGRAREAWDELEGSCWLVIRGRSSILTDARSVQSYAPGLNPGMFRLALQTRKTQGF